MHIASVLSTEEKCDADGPRNPLHKLLNSSQIEKIETSMHINGKKMQVTSCHTHDVSEM